MDEQPTQEQIDGDNVCCPELLIVECADTDEHGHLVCGYSRAVLTNTSIKTICIGDFGKCVLQGG